MKMPEQTPSYTRMTGEIYDAIYSFKNYESEARRLIEIVDSRKKSTGSDLLDVACGTGAHLPFLVDRFHVVGVDLSKEQIEEAKKRLPGVEFNQGDMKNFDLGRKFDVVTCLFSSIGYVHTPEELQLAVGNMAKHLKTGGVLVIEPWLDRESYNPNYEPPIDEGVLKDGTKVRRFAEMGIDGNISVLKMHHELDGPEGHREFDEEHRLAMHTSSDFQTAFNAAGLSFEFDKSGLQSNHDKSRGLYIGVKQ